MDSDIDFDYSHIYKITSIKSEYTNPLYYENNIQERFVDNTINIYIQMVKSVCKGLYIVYIHIDMYIYILKY